MKEKATKRCDDCDGTGHCPCHRAERAANPFAHRAVRDFDCPTHGRFGRCSSCRGMGVRPADRVSLGETQPVLAEMLEKFRGKT